MAENINSNRNNWKFIESLKFGKNKGYARKLEFFSNISQDFKNARNRQL